MGGFHSSLYKQFSSWPFPDQTNKPIFDQEFGFEFKRKIREFPLSGDEVLNAQYNIETSDYCTPEHIALKKCYREKKPLPKWKCTHERHAYTRCEYDDFIMRMKEYEREKRLLWREHRKQMKAQVQGGETGLE